MGTDARKRVNYFDIAKGIGIILVVLGHLEFISSPLRFWIVSFHMPMFFIISGMLTQMIHEEQRDFKTLIKRKWSRMMIPYIWFSILYFFIELIYFRLTGLDDWYTVWMNVWQSICLHGVSVLWFLPAIFFGELLFLFIRKKLSHPFTILTVVILTGIMYGANWGLAWLNMLYGTNVPFVMLHYFLVMVIRCFFSMAFIAIGYYLYFLLDKLKTSHVFELLIGIGCLLLNIILSQKNGGVDLHFLVFGNPFLYFIIAVLGSMAVLLICKSMEPISEWIPCRILRYYGKNSLIVMATHINSYVLYGAIIISMHIVEYVTHAKNYVFCTCIMVIVFVSEIVIIEVINRYLPFIMGQKREKKKQIET